MAENKNSSIQNDVMILSDEIFNFCREYTEQYDKKGVVVVIYTLMNHLLDEDNASIVDKLKRIPIAYHSQILRIVTNKYAIMVVQTGDVPYSQESMTIHDTLLAESQNFADTLHRIPSPFEMFYLVINSLLADYTANGNHIQNNVELSLVRMFNSPGTQARVMIDYLSDFDKKYDAELKKGVFNG